MRSSCWPRCPLHRKMFPATADFVGDARTVPESCEDTDVRPRAPGAAFPSAAAAEHSDSPRSPQHTIREIHGQRCRAAGWNGSRGYGAPGRSCGSSIWTTRSRTATATRGRSMLPLMGWDEMTSLVFVEDFVQPN